MRHPIHRNLDNYTSVLPYISQLLTISFKSILQTDLQRKISVILKKLRSERIPP